MDSDPQTALAQQLSGFYITFWRVPREIRMITGCPLRLGILSFELRESSAGTFRYATNGLSWHVSGVEPTYRSEFYVATRRECPNAFSLLTSLCTYAAGSRRVLLRSTRYRSLRQNRRGLLDYSSLLPSLLTLKIWAGWRRTWPSPCSSAGSSALPPKNWTLPSRREVKRCGKTDPRSRSGS